MTEPQDHTLEVEGMTCNTCALSINKRLEKMGLKEVYANYTTGEVSFINDANIDEQRIEQEIAKLGFHVVHDKSTGSKGLATIEKKFLFALIFTFPLFLHMFLPADWLIQHPLVQLGLALPVYALGFWHFGRSAWGSLKGGVINMDVLIFIGSTAAFGYSLAGTIQSYGTPAVHDYMFFETAATIITLVLLGNVLEHRSVDQTSSAIKKLGDLRSTEAKRIKEEQGQESTETIPAEQVQVGDRLMVADGDKVPVDGMVESGEALIDESMITGESKPVRKQQGDQVIGGTILRNGNLRVTAEKVGDETVLSNIIQMVKKAQQDKPNIQQLGDKVSSIFVPAVVSISLLAFVVSFWIVGIELQNALMNSVAVLVISCPCAMGLATPTAVVSGIGRAARSGILIKGGSTLEGYAKVKNVVFDKTGTLTTGRFRIKAIHPENSLPEQDIRNIILSLEQYSSHPIAKALVEELQEKGQTLSLEEVHEEKGRGMIGTGKDGTRYSFGSALLSEATKEQGGEALYLTRNDQLIARIEVEDEVRKGAKALIQKLNERGLNTILLSGDKKEKCESLARKLGIKTVHSEKLPEEKLEIITRLSEKEPTAMVGDGINDAPALARANIGVSLGNATEVAIQSAKVVILDSSNLEQVDRSLALSQITLKTIKQNLFWAFFYNVVAIPIAAVGLLNPMIAALAMAFSDVVVIGNSLLLKVKRLP